MKKEQINENANKRNRERAIGRKGKTAQREAHKMPFMSVKNRRGTASRRRFFIFTAVIPFFTVMPRRGRKRRILRRFNFLSLSLFPNRNASYFHVQSLSLAYVYGTYTLVNKSTFCLKTLPKDDYSFIYLLPSMQSH